MALPRTNGRAVVIDRLVPYFDKSERYFLLVGDMGFGKIENLTTKHPARVLNCGVAEQSMVSIAAGMAMAGWVPIVYTIVNFLVYRALEQVRNDIVLQDLVVKLIGTGKDNYFERLGLSHCCGKDDRHLMTLIGMPTYELKDYETWLTTKEPAYLRA